MNRYICIHGHFYQPPRENPWLDDVELQDSAYPYHDWNERITAECYAPNTSSRILDDEGIIVDIVNNYSGMSFNFGPTLLSWLERHKPDTYQAILDADRKSREAFSGHGSAIAQVYNHLIMPLADTRDKRTQILWGLKDFEYRFARKAEGMWLAETAVDLETLDIMAEYGILFTILAPHQAHLVRKIGSEDWEDVSNQKVDPKMPYLCRLPSGRTIAVFFYDGPIALDVSFRNLLRNGEDFANRLLGTFNDGDRPQLVNIATDGETYGHHFRFGEMALTYCLHHITANQLARITVYGEYLELFPPTHEVEIFENSSWSCAHGVDRWRADCGCKISVDGNWNQKWRKPLRDTMDWLRDTLIPLYESGMSPLFHNPWKLRDDYIGVILDRSTATIDGLFSRHAKQPLSEVEKTTALKYLETQRNAMLMYTSCGWFFDDISGIESIQVLSYAANAMQTTWELAGLDLEPDFLTSLGQAASNNPTLKNGANVYKKFVKPAIADLSRVGAHYAVSSLFEEYPQTLHFYCFTADSTVYELKEAGNQKLAIGTTRISSHITLEESDVSFAILHLGDHNIIGGIRMFMGKDMYDTMYREIDTAFVKSNIAEVIRLIEKHFGHNNYSLWHLFRDEQRKVLNQVIRSALEERESSFRQSYKQYYPIMQVMESMNIPLPKAFDTTAEFTLNTDLRNILETDAIDFETLESCIEEIKRWNITIDKKTLGFVAMQKVNSLMGRLQTIPENTQLLETINKLLQSLDTLALELNMWEAQNIYFSVGKKTYTDMHTKKQAGDSSAAQWLQEFDQLGHYLRIGRIKLDESGG